MNESLLFLAALVLVVSVLTFSFFDWFVIFYGKRVGAFVSVSLTDLLYSMKKGLERLFHFFDWFVVCHGEGVGAFVSVYLIESPYSTGKRWGCWLIYSNFLLILFITLLTGVREWSPTARILVGSDDTKKPLLAAFYLPTPTQRHPSGCQWPLAAAPEGDTLAQWQNSLSWFQSTSLFSCSGVV